MTTLLILGLLLAPQDDTTKADELIEQLNHPDLEKREAAEAALKTLALKNPKVDALVEMATESKEAEVRTRATNVHRVRCAARLVPDPEALRHLEAVTVADLV